jgi:DNA-binding XRE family transcriptional regulator
MFFNFLEEADCDENRIPAVWEAEIAIASVLIEAQDSVRELDIDGLRKESLFFLKHRRLSDETLMISRRHLKHLVNVNSKSLKQILKELNNPSLKTKIKNELSPDKEKIRAAIKLSSVFSKHLNSPQ